MSQPAGQHIIGVYRTTIMDNSPSHQQRRRSLIPLSPSQTPWSSERASRDSRSSDDNSSNKQGVNVQVILRCRPLSEDEIRVRTQVVISCNELKREVNATQNISNKLIDRTFVFDKVFGSISQQKELYDQAIAPIVNEALEGYNCTIFAYGQTGTGKTYTMEGEGRKEKNGEFHNDAGVIPRAVQQIFDILEAQNTEYSMKVTFLELYNEEISDLLALDDKSKKPIVLMEDGKGAVFVRGLEEEIVCTADEIFKILEKGSARKHTAESLLNKQSNRSHSIFSVTINIKECTPKGEELIKCGKLNLVDLAGSENILRSGAREGRAREAGEINKSLLTLGRVINALVEQAEHVPYRDSKLTRLLRDSLGGKTKTCIIATVSPSIHCLEETLSTLDYAYRAKNIKNRPEVNQRVLKSAMIKDLYTEIDHLKQELHATREKNGIYIPRDRYLNEEAMKKVMAEKLERMKIESKFKDKQLMDLQELYTYQQQLTTELSEKLLRTKREFEQTEQALFVLEERCKQANETIKEKEYFIFNLLGSEKALTQQAFELRAELENAASEASSLFANIECKSKMEDRNRNLIKNFHSQLAQQLEVLHRTVADFVTQHEQQLKVIEENTQTFLSAKAKVTEELRLKLGKLKDVYGSGIKSLNDRAREIDEIFSYLLIFSEVSLEADAILNDLQSTLNNQEERMAAFAQQQHEEFADNEERQLLDKVAELLASSNTRKKKLVQSAVDDLRESATSRTSKLHQEMSNMQDFTLSVQEEWTSYMGKTEAHYTENTISVESGKNDNVEGLKQCMTKARMVAKQWQNAQESLLSLQRRNIDSVDWIIKGGMEANQMIFANFSSIASTTLEEADVANRSLISSTDYALKRDSDAHEKTNSLIASSCEDIREMKSIHSQNIIEITENARKCMIDEYMVDEPLCLTPRKILNLPSTESIEDLRTPSFDELLKAFRATIPEKQANGDVHKSSEAYELQILTNGGAYTQQALHRANGLDYTKYGRLIQQCTDRGLVCQAKQLHARLLLSSVVLDNFLASKLINFYAKSNHLREAHKVFDQIPYKNTFSWNAMLIGYCLHNMHIETLKLFSSFISSSSSTKPDNFTVTCVLKALSSLFPDIKLARIIHCFVLRNGFDLDIFVVNALVTYYSRCDDLASARTLFDMMPKRDLVSWNSMIAGYSQGGFYEDCKRLYSEMLGLEGLRPDGVTVVIVLQACAQSNDLVFGIEVHRFVIENKIELDLAICNSFITLYAKCGSLDYARELFEEMSEKDEITYGAIISGYMVHGFVDKAMDLFREMKSPGLSTWNAVISGMVQNNWHEGILDLIREMQRTGFRPNTVTLSTVLPTLSYFSNLKGVKEIHAYAVRNNFDRNIYVATAIIDTYAKLGFLHGAQKVFDQSRDRSVILWTAIISAYAAHGDANMALDLYDRMLKNGTLPDPVTFTAVLAACAHSGAVDEACKIFDAMLPKYGIQPLVEHYACMVGTLGRAGKLSEAVEFISKMPIEPSAKVWGALLNGASVSGDVELGKFVCDRLFEIEPENTGNFIIMANLFSRAGRWEEAEKVRERMKNIGLKKIAGSSWIETSGGLQSFIAKDVANERTEELYRMLDGLLELMREEGYVLMDEIDEESVCN
ncbi:hypothetical protein F0562_016395 [Nyssa sinensis]|uniref:Kinesin motor domain-containing protein n=1 Tax=Nyssa sinensis TaxID=561372 RepID=A0A5J4ZP26_9ASTE|nr:hypothetical protein F0562_016395 [Nyssa sinensis]